MANTGTRIYTVLFGKKQGTDEFGNIYYTNGKKRRWVIYNGIDEASRVPAEWHRWLHKTTDEVPQKDRHKHKWEKPHLPNLTGTDMAYVPKGHLNKGGKRDAVSGDYQPWKPE